MKFHLRRFDDPVVITAPIVSDAAINRWLRRSDPVVDPCPDSGAATMPKPPKRDKNFPAVTRTASRVRSGKTIALKDLLAKAGITASAIAQRTVKQETWQDFLESVLPDGLAAHINAVSAKDGMLTVLADSPSWAVRLRYALEEALPLIRKHDGAVQSVAVKVAGR